MSSDQEFLRPEDRAAFLAMRKRRSRALGLILFALAVILFAVSYVKVPIQQPRPLPDKTGAKLLAPPVVPAAPALEKTP
jgi:hypothetical protein